MIPEIGTSYKVIFIVIRKQKAINLQRIQEFRTFSVNDAECLWWIHPFTDSILLHENSIRSKISQSETTNWPTVLFIIWEHRNWLWELCCVSGRKMNGHQIYSQWLFYIFLFLAFLFAVNNNKMSMKSKWVLLCWFVQLKIWLNRQSDFIAAAFLFDRRLNHLISNELHSFHRLIFRTSINRHKVWDFLFGCFQSKQSMIAAGALVNTFFIVPYNVAYIFGLMENPRHTFVSRFQTI